MPDGASTLDTLRAYVTDTAQRKGVVVERDGAGGYAETRRLRSAGHAPAMLRQRRR
jgi:hypothetical protein